MGNYIIETNNLMKKFGKFTAVKNLNLKITRNKIHGFIGPNGAGKTTTIRMLTGAIHPSGGEGKIDKYPIGSRNGRSLIGYAPAESLFYQNMTTIDYLIYMGQLKGLSKKSSIDKAFQLIDYFGLGDSTYRNPYYFSSGMKKKVMVAQALINDPQILILDEPTANLDPTARISIIEILKQLIRERNLSIFISSHILSELESLVDEVTLIRSGEIVLSGSLDEIKYLFNEGQYVIKTTDNEALKRALDMHCNSYVTYAEDSEEGVIIIKVDKENRYRLEGVIPALLAYYELSLLKFVEKEITLDDIYKKTYNTKEIRG